MPKRQVICMSATQLEEGHKAAGWKTLEQNTSTTCVTTFMNNQPLFGQGRWVELNLLVVVYTFHTSLKKHFFLGTDKGEVWGLKLNLNISKVLSM